MSTLLLERPTLFEDRSVEVASTVDLLAPARNADVILLHAFARRRRPLSMGDLLRAMTGTGATLSEVVERLVGAVGCGHLAARGFRRGADGRPEGPLLYELTELGWQAVRADRLATI